MRIKKFLKPSLDVMLYRFSSVKVTPVKHWPDFFMGYRLIIHRPRLFKLGEYGLNPYINLVWHLITYGRYKVLLLFDDEIKVHSFYIVTKSYRYPYMSKKDINLAQAITNPEYQRRGILTNVLKLITAYYSGKSNNIWVYCHISNLASQKANIRAGFDFIGYAKLSRITRIVRIIETGKDVL